MKYLRNGSAKQTIGKRLAAAAVSLGLLAGASAGLIGADTVVAAAGTATGCGTVLIPGSQWLQGQGVDVLSNGVGAGSCSGGWSGAGFQCFDLASRLYSKFKWPMPLGKYAKDIPKIARA